MEDHATRLKRLRMRSWHRGIKEMDLILGGFADDEMSKLSLEELNEHELMMSENDHDLYNWVSGKSEVPPEPTPVLSILFFKADITSGL